MIPKVIHYCWFGGKPLPKSAIKCINSWKKSSPITKSENGMKATLMSNDSLHQGRYAAKKYAFVSDFARFWILHEYGGIYFDTDVEVIQPMDDILEKGAFMGVEKATTATQSRLYVNPGIGLACPAKHQVW